jgi:very-short-patch-repair endonuclease
MVRHWRHTGARPGSTRTEIVEALAQACRCQGPRAAIATLDSAWHRGWVDEEGISEVFARLPRRFRVLRKHLDQRSESGPETLVRLMARGLGCAVEVQVQIAGVGRVDLVLDGWLVIECDSREFHEGWESQQQDRARDLALASRGFVTLRPWASVIMWQPETVVAAIRGVLASRI